MQAEVYATANLSAALRLAGAPDAAEARAAFLPLRGAALAPRVETYCVRERAPLELIPMRLQ